MEIGTKVSRPGKFVMSVLEQEATLAEVFLREIHDHKVPLSLGKTCPVKCAFCYEMDISYRKTFDTPLTTEDQWQFMLNQIRGVQDKEDDSWVWGGNEYMEWTDIFLHPKALDWMEEFLETTDKKVTMFTVGYVDPKRINRMAERFPGRINFELSVITLSPYRKRLMPHAPTIDQVLEILDGPAVTSANFYSLGPDTMSKDAKTISNINKKCNIWVGCLTPLKYIDADTTELMRQGERHLADEAQRMYDMNLPNSQMIHTQSYITAFLNRKKIIKVFDACELDKKDWVVAAGSVYRILNLFRKNRARYLYVPNATLGGDSDCSTLLTFSDVAQVLTDQTQVYLPKVIMERAADEEIDIAGETFDEFKAKFPRIRFKVLHKANTYFSNRKLYEKGYVKNYVEDYIKNPLSKKFEAVPLPN